MVCKGFIKGYSCALLLTLMAAFVGHKVHIFNEDPAHYPGFSGNQVPDNGADSSVVARCIVDDFYFFPYLEDAPFIPDFHLELLGILQPQPTCCKLAATHYGVSLRAPPVAS